MTFRTRSAPRPTRRRTRRSDSRRVVYITLAFSLAIVASLGCIGGVFAASYYGDHGQPIATANGEKISKDGVRDRAALNLARYERQLTDYKVLLNQGKITTDESTALTNTIQTSESPSTIYSDALTQLIDEAELRQYAGQNNITVTDQMIDAQIVTDSTIPEMRHVKIIGVPTKALPPASSPTGADSLAALSTAQGYLAELQTGGKQWVDVDKEATLANNNSSGGDMGLTTRDTISADPDLSDAIFALQKAGDITTIFKGSDGSYRFATVTSIAPKYVDTDWQTGIGARANLDQYRAYARAEAIQKAVQASIEAKYISGPTRQRKVQEIAVSAGLSQPGDGDEVKLRLMIFAPAHSTSNATNIPATDPAWADAKTRADAAVATLRADQSKWATMASDTTVNDDTIFNSSGGELPWIPTDLFNATTTTQSQGLNMPSVQATVFKDGLAPGTILDPIMESAQGYVLVQFQGRRQAPAQRIANALFAINGGTDFSDVAKTFSEAADAPTGGDLGWVSPYMLTSSQQNIIFSTPVGRVSNIASGNGYYLYKVLEEQTRVADADQQAKLKKVVFSRWLAELQANALVWKDSAALTAMAPASATSASAT
jgi:parvulin-like peptidyl-prolyl isomerase